MPHSLYTALTSNLTPLPKPTPWPKANHRLLGVATNVTQSPLDIMANFGPDEFERFVLEWADDYLKKLEGYCEVQQRGGAGDKGRDIVCWLDESSVPDRRYDIYQCKKYQNKVGTGDFWEEVGKLIFYTFRGDYPIPRRYRFVALNGVVGPVQDLLDQPCNISAKLLDAWEKHCLGTIRKEPTPLTAELIIYIKKFPFDRLATVQPHDLLNQHAETKYHPRIFGLPMIMLPPPPPPPSEVDETVELVYVTQIYDVISEQLNKTVSGTEDFSSEDYLLYIFEKARLAFYSAEGLKETIRDRLDAEESFFELMDEYFNALELTYRKPAKHGLERMERTQENALNLPLGAHPLAGLLRMNDRIGMCHHLANINRFRWRKP